MKSISLPFRLDGYGRVAVTTDIKKIFADRVRTVISTYPGERVMRPTFGTFLPDDLFGDAESTESFISADVQDAFALWLPDLQFEDVEVIEKDGPNGSVEVRINYTAPNVVSDANSPVYTVSL